MFYICYCQIIILVSINGFIIIIIIVYMIQSFQQDNIIFDRLYTEMVSLKKFTAFGQLQLLLQR